MARQGQRTAARAASAARRAKAAPAAEAASADEAKDEVASGGRALWTGQIRLSLVAVPVRLHAAVRSSARLALHQIHRPSGKRIRYEKIAPGVGPVDVADIVRGYEISRGHYVLLEDEEIDRLRVEAKRTFELVQFVDHCEIDPIYFDRPYYVTPDGQLAEDAYRVLRDALRRTRKLGLGQLVLRGREYLATLAPCGPGLMLETLRFADEIRAAHGVFAPIDATPAAGETVELAEELIRRKTAAFDATSFHDRYADALKALIDAKAAKRPPLAVDEEAPPSGAQIIDLVAALKQSVGEAGGKRAPKSAPARRRRSG
ncbi:MAG TPA: Ku protein [Gammaproteobacteria bacterium]|nr:Ku protein [Gammaproteobacteria bacterium]